MGAVYSKYKIFHFKDKLDKLQNGEISPPIQVRIKPTNACNHDCWYCAYKASNLQLGKDMRVKDFIPWDKMSEIIDDLDEMGVKSITFSGGGEPLSYKFMLLTLKKLCDTKIKFASLSNGALLKGEIAEIFAARGTWLRISIDGYDEKSYARYRGVREGEFSKVLKNMADFAKISKSCLLGVSIIIDKDNASHLDEMVARFVDIGVKSIKLSPCITNNEAELTNAYHSSFFEKTKQKCQSLASKYKNSGCEIHDGYHLQLTSFKKGYEWCPYLQICPVIGADLNVYACHDKAYNLQNGLLFGIKDKSFKQAWYENQQDFYKIRPCTDCDHHCVVDDKNKMLLDYFNVDKEHLDFV